ncbi:MAG TPA: MDR family MFS transporter, partial [Ktedonobacterales bacterium]|nr:MDR family MFS transporter [Ktedonobacterales bacterium]
SLMLTLLLAALDQTIVSTALPTILSDLHGFSLYTWVVTGYLITSTTMVPIVGKLSDQFGRKWFIVAGVLIFLTGSALSGASQTMGQLITFRAIQGVGAGMLLSLVFTSIGDIFTPAERARWQGLFTGVFALASVIGPSLGGWITDNSTWRWIFYINLPIGVAALFFLIFYLPTNISVRSSYQGWAGFRRIDFAGSLTAAAATVLLLLGLTWGGQTYPWGSWQVVGALVTSGVLFVTFFVVERFAAEPILPLDLFRNQIFASGALLALLVGMALFAVVLYLPLFIQGVLGQSASNSGAVITPLTLSLTIVAILGGFAIARVGRYQWLAILGGITLLFGFFLLSRMDASTQLLTVSLDMVVVGLALGLLQPVMTLAVQNALPRSRLGVGTGAVTYLRSLGSTLGTAIVGSIVNNTITNELTTRLAKIPNVNKLPPAVVSAATNQQVLVSPSLRHQLVTQVTSAAVAKAKAQAVAQALAKAKAQANAQVPAGPQHDQIVESIVNKAKPQITHQVTQQVTPAVTHQVQTLFSQLFEATRQALAIGIQHAFTTSLIIGAAAIVVTLFLKDVPLVGAKPRTAPAAARESAPTAHPEPVGALAMTHGATPAASGAPVSRQASTVSTASTRQGQTASRATRKNRRAGRKRAALAGG